MIIDNVTTESDGGGIYGHYSNAAITNCTLSHNTSAVKGGATYWEYSSPIIRNSILWADWPSEIEYVDSDIQITYSDIQRGFEGSGNIDAPPLFTSGPDGGHYLSHSAAGQFFDSPCINAGDDLSENICIKEKTEPICLNELTARTDKIPDTDQVDMGFHYPAGQEELPIPAASLTMCLLLVLGIGILMRVSS